MGGDDSSGERDVGDVASIGVDSRIERGGGALKLEAVTRAGG
jgi:hypothetical protein